MDDSNELTDEQLYFVRVVFQNRVLMANGQQYETLFVSVMTKRYPNFRPIKPQGSKGDQGNDGFIPEEGRYFQSYAPEKPSEKVKEAVEKATNDFAKIIDNWNDDAPVADYRFVFNDKFQGAFPDIEHAIVDVKNTHNLREAKPFLAKDLESEFMALSSADMAAVLGGVVPRAEFIPDIDFAALTEVLQHLVDNRLPIKDHDISTAPDFESKIKFNDIGAAECYLKAGNYQNAAVEEYFNKHGEYSRTQVRDLMANAYETSRCPNSNVVETNQGDRVFFRLLDIVAPSSEPHVQEAALVLISYFFEKCDVFEDPAQ